MSRLPRFAIPRWVFDTRLGIAVATVAFGLLTAGLAPLLGEDEIVAVTMLFLLVVLLVSATWGYGVGLFSAVFADLLLNVFFVPPLHTVTVQEPRNVVALVIFLAVAVVGASMLSLLRRQLAIAQERRYELTIMLELSRELAAAPNPQRALDVLARAALITSEGITHVTLVAQSRGRLAAFARPTLADRLLDRHPHLDVHLVRAM